jgi:hypothetical protein
MHHRLLGCARLLCASIVLAGAASARADVPPDPDPASAALAARFAPVVYFDQRVPGGSGVRSKCLPQSAEPYYEARLRGDHQRICNQDVASLASVPAYYDLTQEGGSTFITYWFFYGYQSTCLPGLGSHDSDWERVTVRVAQGQLRDVVYWQHNGRYTRRADDIRLDDGHPVVYSGKNSHGSYHDAGGSGGCRYFADYRNPGSRNLRWQTAGHLQPLAAREEAWMRAPPTADGWSKMKPPTRRGPPIDETVCRHDAARLKLGALTLTQTDSCLRSDYRDATLRIRDLATSPERGYSSLSTTRDVVERRRASSARRTRPAPAARATDGATCAGPTDAADCRPTPAPSPARRRADERQRERQRRHEPAARAPADGAEADRRHNERDGATPSACRAQRRHRHPRRPRPRLLLHAHVEAHRIGHGARHRRRAVEVVEREPDGVLAIAGELAAGGHEERVGFVDGTFAAPAAPSVATRGGHVALEDFGRVAPVVDRLRARQIGDKVYVAHASTLMRG